MWSSLSSPKTMWLTPDLSRAILAHARAEAPREACGLIVGREQRAAEIIPIPNLAADPLHAYSMDPAALVRAFTSLEARKLDLIAFYHSHPHSDPIPSPADVKQATYPDTPYLIVSLPRAEARLWRLHYGQVSEELLYVGSQPTSEPQSLSNAQKTAILLSALIAVVLLIVVSLSLLPPAPAH